MVKKLKWHRGVFIFIIMFAFPSFSLAEEFPIKPIEWYCPSGTGGSNFIAMTTIGEAASKYLGQRIVVVPLPGAGTMLASARAARANPDGYTLVLASSAGNGTVLYTMKDVPYKNSDFEFIAKFGGLDIALFVKGNSPFKTLEDYLEFAKKNPGVVKTAGMGIGTTSHLALELLKLEVGRLKIDFVPFKTLTEVRTAVLGGHVHAGFTYGGGGSMGELSRILESGGRILASARKTRSKLNPDVPTFVEKRINMVLDSWYGVAGPKGMPKEVSQKLMDTFYKVFKDPKIIQDIENMGFNYEFLDSEGFTRYVAENEKLIKRIVGEANIPKS